MKATVKIKPLSVNEAWQGRRFKTQAYKAYEKAVLLLLPNQHLPEPPYLLLLTFGVSNMRSDWDNPVKPLQDILSKRYGFNDKDIIKAQVCKCRVDKGQEYFSFEIMHIKP